MKKKFFLPALLLLLCTLAQGQIKTLQDSLDAARITAVREKMRNTTQTGLMRLDAKELKSGVAVFGSPDIIKKLQLLPGVAAGNELMSGLYVHGGDGNDNLFLLDGIPLYNISHFGGLFSSFNTDVIDNLDFYKSGFPARYGSRLSSVVDVETREGDMQKYHGSFSLGLIDGRLQLEGPIVKGKTSFNLGLRRSWMDLVTIPALWYANRKNGDDETATGGYAMSDLNARLTHRFAPGNTLNVCFYTGSDYLRAGLTEKQTDGEGHYGENLMKIGVKWGSLTASASHQYEFSKKLKSKNVLYYSQSTSDTGYQFSFWTWAEGDSVTSMDDNNKGYVKEIGLKSDWDWYPDPFHHVRYGLSLQEHWYHSGRKFTSSTPGADGQPGILEDSEALGYRSFEPALYAEDEIFLRYNLTVNLGVRYALFKTAKKVYHSPEPRIAFKWMLSNSLSAKLSYTRMSQFAHLVAAMYMDLPSNSWMPSTDSARPMLSDQIAGGLYFTPHKYVKINLEGWYKTMDHLLVYNGSNTFTPPLTEWEKSFADGKGKSYGLEWESTYDNGKLALSAYYTLSWTLRRFDALYGEWFPDRNDNRHKINLVASWRFAKNWSLFANWNFHSGNRITFPSHFIETDGGRKYVFDAPYNTQLPAYHRLDVGLDWAKTFDNGHGLSFNLSVYNAYNHLNASMAFLETHNDGTFSGMAYGLIPIIPTVSVTYKF
ncbi:MAG: TonB-dependent receptor plug domain-containing protein [Bacteroidales bacterium]|nr:TonB-dependent receptor plug domain-containing protein [Bacteroidales bacterium]